MPPLDSKGERPLKSWLFRVLVGAAVAAPGRHRPPDLAWWTWAVLPVRQSRWPKAGPASVRQGERGVTQRHLQGQAGSRPDRYPWLCENDHDDCPVSRENDRALISQVRGGQCLTASIRRHRADAAAVDGTGRWLPGAAAWRGFRSGR